MISEEVWEEARARDEAAKRWCDSRGKAALVVPTNAQTVNQVTTILNEHPKLVKNLKGRNRADAFVIAVAQAKHGIVVTGEGANGTAERPKIPFICSEMGLQCVRFLDLIKLEGWKF